MKTVTDWGKARHELPRALHVDVHHDVLPAAHHTFDFRPQRAVQVPVDLGGFGESPPAPAWR